MDTPEHNNSKPAGSFGRAKPDIETLGDLIEFVAGHSDLAPSKNRFLLSALRRARALLGNGQADVKAESKSVLQQLDRLSPAMAGMTPQSYANLKSRVRSAFRLAAPNLTSARSYTPLEGEWKTMQKRLGARGRELSRLFRFAQASGWHPADLGPEHLQRFAAYVSEDVLVDRIDKIIRTTISGLEPCSCCDARLEAGANSRATAEATALLGTPGRALSEPCGGIDHYLQRRADPDPFIGDPSKPLAAGTIRQYRFAFIQLVSALVARGKPIGEIDSLSTLLSPENVETALRFFHARAGDRVTQQIEQLAFRALKVARESKAVSERELQQLRAICERVREAVPCRRQLTKKNRRLLEHMDNRAFVDRLLNLPQQLMVIASKQKNEKFAAAYVRDAVAIELLLTCGLRAGNIVDLRLGETIRKLGEGRDARWVIEIPGERVKNGQPLRFVLLPESVRLTRTVPGEMAPALVRSRPHPGFSQPARVSTSRSSACQL